mgnify:CR=1 FL=1
MKKSDREIIYYTNQIVNTSNTIYQVFTAYHNRGILYFKKRCYKKAIDDFTSALERSSTLGCWSHSISTRAHNSIKAKEFFLRGIAYIKINNLDKGIDDFNKALDLDSEVIKKNKFELSILPLEISGLIRSFFDI